MSKKMTFTVICIVFCLLLGGCDLINPQNDKNTSSTNNNATSSQNQEVKTAVNTIEIIETTIEFDRFSDITVKKYRENEASISVWYMDDKYDLFIYGLCEQVLSDIYSEQLGSITGKALKESISINKYKREVPVSWEKYSKNDLSSALKKYAKDYNIICERLGSGVRYDESKSSECFIKEHEASSEIDNITDTSDNTGNTSDNTGITDEESYKNSCIEVFYEDVFKETANLEGRRVKVSVWLEKKKKYYPGDYEIVQDYYNVEMKENFFTIGVQHQDNKKDYTGYDGTLYFPVNGSLDAADYKTGNRVTVYGDVVADGVTITGTGNFVIMAKYIEKEEK